MSNFLKTAIKNSFLALFLLVPLVLFSQTSELFEFNKMVLTYLLTILIVSFWILRMIIIKKIIFRRTMLDIPLILFLLSQFISTLFSIDPLTSLFGYYSRFHGGLLSSLSYALLYWAFVSNMGKKKTLLVIRYSLFATFLVSVYGILQHFGIDKEKWIQDVQNRIFSTLGQPNWLAAWLVALMPIYWAFALERESGRSGAKKLLLFYSSSLLLFLTLLYTKSRSGFLGFLVADLLFWISAFFVTKRLFNIKLLLKQFLIFNFAFLILGLVIGSPWTPSLQHLINRQATTAQPTGPALETGGTESGQIRKIVWKGALDVWKNNPLFGTGVETFAYSYFRHRPKEHNLVSEWDFLYNKAHNEFLNMAANTGTLGLIAYLILILYSVFQISNAKLLISNKIPILKFQKLDAGDSLGQLGQLEIRIINVSLLAGYASILVTNFFGFSVVPVALLFFLFPAMAVSLEQESEKAGEFKNIKDAKSLSIIQKLGLILLSASTLLLSYFIYNYWFADVLYQRGIIFNDQENYPEARKSLLKAIDFSPLQPVYYNELAQAATGLALSSFEQGDLESGKFFSETALAESDKAISYSPYNLNFRRTRVTILINLSAIDPQLLNYATDSLLETIILAPTHAKFYYNLGLNYMKLRDKIKAEETLTKAVELKENYRDARFALAVILAEKGEKEKARVHLNYILTNINPNDLLTRQQLQEMK